MKNKKRGLKVLIAALCVFTIIAAGCSKNKNANDTDNNDDIITIEEAKEIAVKDAGLNKEDVNFINNNLNLDDGKQVYDIEFFANDKEYDYEIDAISGKIISSDFDAGNKDSSLDNAPTSTNLTVEKAKEMAVNHAGLDINDVKFLRAKLDKDDGRTVYDIEFYTTDKEYDYEIDANNGEVVSSDFEVVNKSANKVGASIDEKKAKAIALKKVPGASDSNIMLHLDHDNGKAVYEGNIIYQNKKYEFDIDASSGEIIEWSEEKGMN